MPIRNLGRQTKASTRSSFEHEGTGHILDIQHGERGPETMEIQRKRDNSRSTLLRKINIESARLFEDLWKKYSKITPAKTKGRHQIGTTVNVGGKREQPLSVLYIDGKLRQIMVGLAEHERHVYTGVAHELVSHALKEIETA